MGGARAGRDLATADAGSAEGRNPVVDLLRVVALAVVVLGHWVMQGVYLDEESVVHRSGLLSIAPWTHPFTWLLQVMPVFFLVGGYANAVSWRRARSRGLAYGDWLHVRVTRLTRPLIPLLLFWVVVSPNVAALGLGQDWLRVAAKASLVPTWFLAVYLLVVACVPLALGWWERWGLRTVVVALLLAAVADAVSLATGVELLAMVNVFLVWGAIHQLGFAWVDRALPGPWRPLAMAAVGLVGAVLLVWWGPYSVSMVGVTGFGLDNTYPPRVTLGFLGLAQAGVALALEPALARLLRHPWPARVSAIAGRRIMTVYLWHLTALGVAVAVAVRLGGVGLTALPNTGHWWATRPAWFVVLGCVTALAVRLFGRFEDHRVQARRSSSALGPLVETVVFCAALGALAGWGLRWPDGTVVWWLPLIPVLVHVARTGGRRPVAPAVPEPRTQPRVER
jgi:surface polysaccharide O-acyltransferase-like enzyme